MSLRAKLCDYCTDIIINSKLYDYPFNHIQLDNFFPEELYNDILNKIPLTTYPNVVEDNYNPNNFTDTKPDNLFGFTFSWYLDEQIEPFPTLKKLFSNKRFITSIKNKLEIENDISYTPYCDYHEDYVGTYLPPHKDFKLNGSEYVITFILYITDNLEMKSDGKVSLLNTDGEKVKTVNYEKNKGYILYNNDISWHMVEKTSYTRNVLMCRYKCI